MLRKLLLFFILILSFCCGCNNRSQSPQMEDPALTTARNYIKLSSEGEWKEALRLLSGEALEDAENNLRRNPRAKGSMLLKDITLKVSNNPKSFAIVRADFKKGEEERSFFYYLRRIEERWYIFKLSDKDPDLPNTLQLTPVPTELIQNLEERFSGIMKSNAGQSTGCVISNLNFSGMGSTEGVFLVEVTYAVETNLNKPQNRRIIYTLKDVNGSWQVSGTDVVQVSK